MDFGGGAGSSLGTRCEVTWTGLGIWKGSGAAPFECAGDERCSRAGGANGDIGGPLAFHAGGDRARNG